MQCIITFALLIYHLCLPGLSLYTQPSPRGYHKKIRFWKWCPRPFPGLGVVHGRFEQHINHLQVFLSGKLGEEIRTFPDVVGGMSKDFPPKHILLLYLSLVLKQGWWNSFQLFLIMYVEWVENIDNWEFGFEILLWYAGAENLLVWRQWCS